MRRVLFCLLLSGVLWGPDAFAKLKPALGVWLGPVVEYCATSARGPGPSLGFIAIQRGLAGRQWLGADLSLGIAAFHDDDGRNVDKGGYWCDDWVDVSQVARVFIRASALEGGIGLGLHEIRPIESGRWGHGMILGDLHFQPRGYAMVRLNFAPSHRHGLFTEFEFQHSLRQQAYRQEPTVLFVAKLGYRFQ